MTTSDRLRAEGYAEGRARGIVIGQARARAECLTEQLTFKFGPLSPHVLATIRAGTADEQQAWMQRLLTATTLDQVFAE
ncbi:hypothetical protein [Nocardia sp. NPDC050435]|uniref:hypothetical protein n=1 Tax=Nocardia sp. NPDC050435 TaxID=3155040 RepID=UPI0033F2CA81